MTDTKKQAVAAQGGGASSEDQLTNDELETVVGGVDWDQPNEGEMTYVNQPKPSPNVDP